MTLRLTGLALALLPLAWWAWQLRDPCGVQGEAWVRCRGAAVTASDTASATIVILRPLESPFYRPDGHLLR